VETRLKQRVIGAVVLIALAIIVLPMLLDGSAEDRARIDASIPEPPRIDLESLSVEDIDRRMQIMEQTSAEQLPKMVEDKGPARPAEELALDANNLPVSWSLQLGSFSKPENALSLRDTLRAAEFHAYIIQARTPEGEMYRVLVGPMLQKSRLAAVGEEIESRFDLKGQIVRYRIGDDVGQLGG
jgi:DedD protein